ncbi:hypothetical protein BOC37_28625 [Burkholderia pseudomallei]|nr:hypothetical protein BOC37_28625 [Burkholderia pseudomallei]
MTRLTDRHKTIPYFKSVLVSSDTWGRSNLDAQRSAFANEILLIEVTTLRQIAFASLFTALRGGWSAEAGR